MAFVTGGRVARAVMAALGMALLPAFVHAQTPPRPAVTVRQLPSMFRSVWPADFNGDGRVDLVAGEGSPTDFALRRVVVRLGNGDGTFGAALATGATGIPAAVGDFNRDTRQDVVVLGPLGAISILPGRGDGTFGPARAIGQVADFRFALAADMNEDDVLDLVIAAAHEVQVQTGRGDFTFLQHFLPPVGESGGSAGVVGDFNGDGRRDLAIAERHRVVSVYINQGALFFIPWAIEVEAGFEELPEELHGIATADLNGDGRDDLIVPHTKGIFDYDEGGVDVLFGRSDGLLSRGGRYFTGLQGPWTAVTGDFNRDGLVDVAVGGRSWSWDDIADLMNYWDSVSIFPGRGNGTLAPAAPFRLDSRPDRPGFANPYTNWHHALRTADFNGDGHDDLVASPGAVVLNRAPAANRPPVANAGPDLTADSNLQTFVSATFAEPDWDWVTMEWRNELGILIRRQPSFEFGTAEDQVLTVTVTDARGASSSDSVLIRRPPGSAVSVTIQEPAPGRHYPSGASVPIRWEVSGVVEPHHFEVYVSRDNFLNRTQLNDQLPAGERSVTWTNAGPPGTSWRVQVDAFNANNGLLASDISEPFTIDEPAAGAFPWPWSEHGDIGAVARPGSATYENGIFTVRGSGADIWGTADEFHYVGTRVSGNFSLTARVLSVENVHQWTKAGLMIRGNTGAASRHASIFVTPTTIKGVAFQERPTIGGASLHTAGPAVTAPVWLKLIRMSNVVTTYARKNITDGWTLVGRQELPEGAVTDLYAMLVVTSHADGRLAAARFDNVVVDELESMSSTDIGLTREGTTRTDGATTRIEGDGADIWGTSDAFRFHHQFLFGDGSITARVRSIENTHVWAKAGVMFRYTSHPAAQHVMLVVSPGRGVALQYRSTFAGESAQAAIRPGTAPEWLRLTRAGNTFTGFASDDGLTWSTVGSVTVRMNALALVGLPVTSHRAGTLATAVFDDVLIRK